MGARGAWCPRGSRLRSARQRGFTLIEILLATMLLAAGLALAFATLRGATATAQRGEAMADRNERMRAVQGFLRRRIASALPVGFAVDENTGEPLRFSGEPTRMRFVADLPDYLGQGGPHVHDIAVLDDDGGGSRLAVSFSIAMAGQAVEERNARPPETLVPALRELRFRYRGLAEDGTLGEWTDSWPTPTQLPLQVRASIVAADGPWPELVVSLPQGASYASGGGGKPVR